jgi:hypothetical protein
VETWAKLFDIGGLQVMATKGSDNNSPSIDFQIRTADGEMILKLVCRGLKKDYFRDEMFTELTADIASTFLSKVLGRYEQDVPESFRRAFKGSEDRTYKAWYSRSGNGGRFDA